MLWIVLALGAGGALLSSLFEDYVERNLDARLSDLMDVVIAVSEVDEGGQLSLTRAPGEPRFDRPFSGWYWQISARDGRDLRSRSLWDQTLALDLSTERTEPARSVLTGPQDQLLLVLERDITLPGEDTHFRYAVAADLAQLEAEIRPFNVTLAWALAILGLGLVIAVLIQVRYGLGPVRRIARALADVRAGRAERLQGGFPIEVKPLADEVNALLIHNAEVVERARHQVGNLAHALKTPLSVVIHEAERSAGPAGEEIGRQAETIRRHLDHYLARARTAATAGVLGARTPALPVARGVGRALERIHAERDLDLAFAGDDGIAFRGERQDLEEMLGNLMENACKWARGRVAVTVAEAGGALQMTIDDDGPGLPAARREEAMKRGRRLDESGPGVGLGLSIVRDIAELYGGDVTLADAPAGGLRVILRLPLAPAPA